MAITDVTSASVLDQYRTNTSSGTGTASNELGQDAFLELMVAQLNNQNPLDPMDNQAFVAQLAQFSSVEGIDNLNSTVEAISSEFSSFSALQASSMVGQSVIIDGNTTGSLRQDGVLSASTNLDASATDLTMTVYNSAGQLLEQYDLGSHSEGALSVQWDGLNLTMDGQAVTNNNLNRDEYLTDSNGELLLDSNGNAILAPYDAGQYQFVLTGTVAGSTEQMAMNMSTRVESVTLASTGAVTLNLTGGQTAGLSDISQILED
ncbi:flagellar hook capping FlgD N-terminal domain-containing protein [Oceanobacter mangrovi]|uniref:flagellar hook capping FlgD N-terminal domain-containing protein n=1 Tax=Oceanobacter mangrovi TaxID=2862510 RepID=UPI001C8EE828|nr:flagellar hook capping FlgD N-terminal domain-containing protein [Oceanobacter mangrovi]